VLSIDEGLRCPHNQEMLLTARRLQFAVLLVTVSGLALAQRYGGIIKHSEGPRATFPQKGDFHFLRLEYTDLPQVHRRFSYASRSAVGEGWWMMDWPDADEHFSTGIQRLTRIDTATPQHAGLTDDRIFDYPWIYATQAGWWDLSDPECQRLQEYLRRGGFLVVDDFWGPDQWAVFRSTMSRVMPDQQIVDLAEGDAVMHVLYDITEKDHTFIPGTRHLRRGPGGEITVEQPEGTTPAWKAIYDEKGRMVVAINFNTDVGDAWEYADSPEYPEAMTTLAYRFGVNYLVYAMTH
jgi:hypothetical protein